MKEPGKAQRPEGSSLEISEEAMHELSSQVSNRN